MPFTSCQSGRQHRTSSEMKGSHSMSTEENIAVVRRWLEEIGNAGKLEVVDEDYAPTFVDHAAMHDQLPGPECVKQLIRMIKVVISDWHYTIEDVIVDEDKVVAPV